MSRRNFLTHVPMKHTPTLCLSASFLDSVCALRTTHLFPGFLPFFFFFCQGKNCGPASHTPTFHVIWLRSLQTGALHCYAGRSGIWCSPHFPAPPSTTAGALATSTRTLSPVSASSTTSRSTSGVRLGSALRCWTSWRTQKMLRHSQPRWDTWARSLPPSSVAPSGPVALRNDTTTTSRVMATSTSTTTPMCMQSPLAPCGAEGTRWQWRASPVALFWWPAGPSWRQDLVLSISFLSFGPCVF